MIRLFVLFCLISFSGVLSAVSIQKDENLEIQQIATIKKKYLENVFMRLQRFSILNKFVEGESPSYVTYHLCNFPVK